MSSSKKKAYSSLLVGYHASTILQIRPACLKRKNTSERPNFHESGDLAPVMSVIALMVASSAEASTFTLMSTPSPK